MMALEPEDRRDPKRARVVLSNSHEVVGLGYSRVTGVAAQVSDKKENSGNHVRVNRVSQNSNMAHDQAEANVAEKMVSQGGRR
jgi:hypothetical protein